MPRDKADKNRGVQFTRKSAEEIAEVVRSSRGGNRDQPPVKLPRAFGGTGVLSKTASAWNRGSSQSLTIYTGDGGSETASSGSIVTAWNYVANLPGNVWVVLARANGRFYLASFDYTGLGNYSSSKQQVLVHDASGVLAWVDTTACT